MLLILFCCSWHTGSWNHTHLQSWKGGEISARNIKYLSTIYPLQITKAFPLPDVFHMSKSIRYIYLDLLQWPKLYSQLMYCFVSLLSVFQHSSHSVNERSMISDELVMHHTDEFHTKRVLECLIIDSTLPIVFD